MEDRRSEWFVPRFGPVRFRLAVGLLFLPYTGMVLSFTLIGSMLAEEVHWDRVGAILLIYLFALGIGAHALDALGSKKEKPWGNAFSPRALAATAAGSILLAYGIGIYYMILYTPLLWIIALVEGFLLLAYNLEWFQGRFHTDGWFTFSWGILPVLAGYILQTNRISLPAILVALSTGLLSSGEIAASRPYKAIRKLQSPSEIDLAAMNQYERILKGLSLGVILLGIGMTLWRWSAA